MVENMHKIIQRINEINKKFNIMRHNHNTENKTENKNSQFQKLVSQPQKEANDKKEVTNVNISEIKRLSQEFAQINNIPSSLVNAIIKVESNYNPKAVSKKGAIGLMQLMPSTIKEIGISNPFDIKENIMGGVSILKRLLEKYNWDYKKALAAYNAGEKAVDDNSGIPPYRETKEYVNKVINSYLQNSK